MKRLALLVALAVPACAGELVYERPRQGGRHWMCSLSIVATSIHMRCAKGTNN
jgi:hypothetical protein